MRRTRVWASAFRNSVIHQIFSEFLQPLRDFRTCATGVGKYFIHKILSEFLQPFWYVIIRVETGSHRTCSWSSFLFGFGILVGSCNNSSDVLEMNGSPRSCLSTRSLDTAAGWWSIPHGSSRSCPSTLSLDSIAGWWSEWSISWPEGVVDVEVDELEGVVDKPGTTTGTKFSVLHCIRMPF